MDHFNFFFGTVDLSNVQAQKYHLFMVFSKGNAKENKSNNVKIV